MEEVERSKEARAESEAGSQSRERSRRPEPRATQGAVAEQIIAGEMQARLKRALL